MKRRYSVRKYSSKAIEQEKLDYILEAGRVAPTAANRQTQRILVVNNKEGLKNLSKSTTKQFNPPTMLIICSNPKDNWTNKFDNHEMNDIDCSIVCTHMMLAAKESGIDSLWINSFNPEPLYEDFNIPKEYKIVNLLALGYTDDEPKSPDRHLNDRKPINETVFFNKF